MKKTTCWITICFILFLSFITPVSAQEAFVIDNANVNMVVHEDGTIDITEKFNLDFKSYRHGFYRYIPIKYEMNWMVDGKQERKKYYFPVKNINCSTACSTDLGSEGVTIKLGDADKQIIGKQEYTISYTVKTKDLDLSNHAQALYWNLIDNFDTTIYQFSYRIDMPKAFDADNVYTYAGKYGQGDDDVLTHQVNGNTISGKITRPLQNKEATTIRVNVPDNYFVYPKAKDYSMVALGTGLVILIASIFLFIKFGKDDDVVVTVEFKAPDGLDSASVGYVIDNSVENRDILSLIIDWANRGFLIIHDEESGFRLEKIKEMEKDNSNGYERVFFDAIFASSDIVEENDLKNTKVSEALTNAKRMLKNAFYHNPKKRVYSSTSLGLQCFMVLLIVIPMLVLNLTAAYAKFEIIAIALPYIIPSIFLILTCFPWIILMQKRYTMKKSTFLIATVILLFLNGVIVTVNAFIQFMFLDIKLYIVLAIAIITFLLILIMMFMDKRTKQGNRWLGQILGLKEFIISCEKDQLEMLAAETPSAFFDVLPYAYVLGISDIWVKKFENIVIPEPNWYRGYGYGNGNVFMTMLWWNHFHYCFRDISTAASYTPPPTTGRGGGSFGGGGFGGGGFSGGGFGGGGGGSW